MHYVSATEMDAAVLGVLLVLSVNSLAIRFDFSSGTKPDTLLYECGDKCGLWTLEDATAYPGSPISGSILTSSLEPCCLKLRNFTHLDERSRFRIKFRASFSRLPHDVMLLKLQGAESSVQVTWLTLKTMPLYDWIDLDEPFPCDIAPGRYQIEIWMKPSRQETISIRYFEITENEKDITLQKVPRRRMPRFATDDVTSTPNEQTVSTSWLTNSTLAPDDIDYFFEICSCSPISSVTLERLDFSAGSTTETTFEITSPITTTETDITFETKLTTITLLENLSSTTEIVQDNTNSETHSISTLEITTVIKLSSQIPINITEESIIVSSNRSTVSDQISDSTKSLSTTTERETTFTETTNSNENSTLLSTTEPAIIFTETVSSVAISSETTSSNPFSTLLSMTEAATIFTETVTSTTVLSGTVTNSNEYSTSTSTNETVTNFTETISSKTASSETISANTVSLETTNFNENSTSTSTNEPVTTETVSSKTETSVTTNSNELSTSFSTMTQTTEESNTSTKLFVSQSNNENDIKEVGITVGLVVLCFACLLGLILYLLVRKLNISAAASLKVINIRKCGTNTIKYKQTITI